MSSLSSAERTRRAEFGASAKHGWFAESAPDYFDLGHFPIPIRVTPDGKRPLVKGWAPGHDNPYPDRERILQWCKEFPRALVGLRLPRTILGLDVDCYDGKVGWQSLKALIARFGPLPPTWVSTSRTDGSGIRLFAVPDSNVFRANPAPGIESIRGCHRFVTVWPSRHGRAGKPQYAWFGPDGRECGIPTPDEIPRLPARWAGGLVGTGGVARARVTDLQAATGWMAGRDEPCATVAATLAVWRRAVKAAGVDGGAYDAARDGVHALLGDAETGHSGAAKAVRLLRNVYVVAVSDRRPVSAAGSEFDRHAQGEVVKRRIPKSSASSACVACREAEALEGWRVRRG